MKDVRDREAELNHWLEMRRRWVARSFEGKKARLAALDRRIRQMRYALMLARKKEAARRGFRVVDRSE